MNNLKTEIFQKVKEYFEQKNNEETKKIGVAYPCFDHKEVNQALDSLLDVWISQGPKVSSFEGSYADYCGVKHGVAVNSGSSANLLASFALINPKKKNYLKPGDNFIIPTTCWSTSLWPLVQCGLKPKFVDVNINTFCLDEELIEKKEFKML